MGIMIQNLSDEHSIHYILSSEHINFFITYPFDFRIDEMLSYYISFLRVISGKLNNSTISLLAKMEDDAQRMLASARTPLGPTIATSVIY
jgi:protein CLEC16A